ncbi:hypothetical protein JL2886_00227 [Phaeobacter gallaeciensis]|uniref:Uncharacterized protein n=1 Tax=Phaeobacter gallaeciensis TaxID=60890 RepID=A0A1B0ZM01_9RHOB|nr:MULTISPECIES: hypothetical protein [Phaeobacter]MDF1771407.1 hypothetical protein [Pseudophaeobacter sp. bin_em_oilr2.035]MEE2634595.1 hypothetical protein [Pseudomonadota bacterium]ANP35160.1 hypothetical protein JL2886_00227 [Phaeobacter gallaeciensis]MDE4061892.1 hypothetical protein [Phaeobacter gallaeciensis]MDE4124920.1 hypothetical protein [Phaeobacter gallaeciensis]
MSTIETLAQKLAIDTLKIQDAIGQDRLYVEVGQVLGAASQSLEEAFLTEIRVRLAERKARDFLNQKIAALQAEAEAQLNKADGAS